MNNPHPNMKLLSSVSPPLFLKEKLGWIFFALAYLLAVRLDLWFELQPGGAFICPVIGLALAALALNPKKQWGKILAVIFFMDAAGNWSGGIPLLPSLGFALINTLEALLCALILTYFCGPKITFGRAVEVAALLGAAVIGNGVTAGLAAAIETLVFHVPFAETWLAWWAADGMSVMLITPVIVIASVESNKTFQNLSAWKVAEAALHAAFMIFFAALLFGPFTRAEEPLLRNYMLFPLLIWLAFRFTSRDMANALLAFSGIAIWNTLQGYGIFSFLGQSLVQRLMALQLYLGVAAFSGLLLSAMISERKRAGEAIRASEEKYRMVADFTHNWEAWYAPQGSYIYVSPSCERLTGYKSSEFVEDANLIVNITYPDDRERIAEHFRAIAEHPLEKDVQFDFRIITKSGEMRWFSHNCAAVYGDNGKWLGCRESNRDITERKESEAVLYSRLWLSQFADNHSIDELLQGTLNEAEALTDSEIGFFHSLDRDQKTLKLQMWSANTLQNLCTAEGKGRHYSVDEAGVWADCVYTRAPIIYNDYASLSHRKGLPEGHAPIQRILVVPIMRNDYITAIFGVGNKKSDYDSNDVKTVSQIADLVWDVVMRKRSEEEVRNTKDQLQIANESLHAALKRETELARTDALTEINNRRYLFELAVNAFDI
ncbi:MAG: MASE1 domain-containing protein, partial [Anaerolineales bacterium]|nr:MASE1 domain-containing protein [Anaerolineales bacterium]